jgi:predicted metal-dependent enzyme (double-stranded beta helix superfamily)
MFDVDALIASCVGCLAEADVRHAVRVTLEEALQRPDDVIEQMRPEAAGMSVLYHAPQLTIIDAVCAPHMCIDPHDHRTWAAVAVYAGREHDQFFRREGATVAPSHGRTLTAGAVILMDDDVVHGVTNPDDHPTAAIHVYGGDFINRERSQWLPPGLTEQPYDAINVARVFAEANSAWHN